MNYEEIERKELEAITKMLASKGLSLEQLQKHSQEKAEKVDIGFIPSDEVTEVIIKKHCIR